MICRKILRGFHQCRGSAATFSLAIESSTPMLSQSSREKEKLYCARQSAPEAFESWRKFVNVWNLTEPITTRNKDANIISTINNHNRRQSNVLVATDTTNDEWSTSRPQRMGLGADARKHYSSPASGGRPPNCPRPPLVQRATSRCPERTSHPYEVNSRDSTKYGIAWLVGSWRLLWHHAAMRFLIL